MTTNVGEGGVRNHPISDPRSGDRIVGRAAPGGIQCLNQAFVKTCLFVRSQEAGDLDLVTSRNQIEVLDAKILVNFHVETDPEWVEGPLDHLAVLADAPHAQFRWRD